MKKRILFLGIIAILCFCFCTLKSKRLQACNINPKGCLVIKASGSVVKESLKNCNVEQVEESEMPVNYLMNPFMSM